MTFGGQLTTRRLMLRPWTDADISPALARDADPAVRRFFLGVPFDEVARRGVYTRTVSGAFPPRGASWVVERLDAPGLLGWVAVFPLDASDELELAYRYVQRAWGQGIATEAAAAARDWAFDALALERLMAVTEPANAGSQRVLSKLGFERCGTGFHYGHDLPVFKLERARWTGRLQGCKPP